MTGGRKGGRLGLAGLLLGGLMIASGAASAVEWRLPTVLPEGSVQVQSLELFGQDLQAATNGRISPAIYPADSLLLTNGLLSAVQRGDVKLAALPLDSMVSWGPLFEADSLPTLASDFASARRLWGVLRKPLQEELWSRDLILLFAAPQTPRGLLGPRSLRSASDLSGLTVGGSTTLIDGIARNLGASPFRGSPRELAEAYRRGRLDAAFLGAPEALRGAGDESAFYPMNSWIPLTVVVAHEPTFETLSRGDQEALRKAAEAAEEQAWAAGQAQNAALVRLLQRDGLFLEAPALRQRVSDAGRRAASDWLARAGLEGEALLRNFRN